MTPPVRSVTVILYVYLSVSQVIKFHFIAHYVKFKAKIHDI